MTATADEHAARQAAVRQRATREGYAAVAAWSRSGGTQDHYADVLYLTGFYTHQPFVPDRMDGPGWHWRAAGHAAVVVPAAGPVTVVVDTEHRQDPQPAADAVVVSADPVRTVADLLADAIGRGRGRVALAGGEALSARWAGALAAHLGERSPAAVLVEDDDLLCGLRLRKSPAERALLRAAGALGSRAIEVGMRAAVPGASEADVAATLIAEVVRGGGALTGLVLSSGPWAHTLAPSGGAAGTAPYTTRRLQAGDVLRIDAYGSVGGYLFDVARSRVVGGEARPEQQEMLDAVRDSVRAGVDMLAPGVGLGAVARRCEEVLAASAYARRHGLPGSPMGGLWGHGLGLAFEPPWIGPESSAVAEPGMCLAVERRIEAPGLGGAQHEDDVLITEDGAELLTAAPSSR